MNIKKRVLPTLCAGALTLLQCLSSGPTDNSQASQGGTGSEIVGMAEYPDSSGNGQPKRLASAGIPAIDARVFMYPESFEPGEAIVSGGAVPKVYTGDDGSFRITDVPLATYIIEVNDAAGKGLTRKVPVLAESTVVNAGTFTLVPTGGLHLSADFQIPGELVYYVGLKGTRIVFKGTQSSLDLTLDDIPTGIEYTLFIKLVKPFEKEVTVSNITIKEKETQILDKLTITQ